MPKCQLSIEIPGDEDFARPGGELDVIVHVSCDASLECEGLSLTRSWRSHGRGNPDGGGQRMEELFRGTWEAGEYAYPTKVPFPTGPTSYHGTLLNVDWYLEARADIPSAGDGSAKTMVLVADPSPPRPYTPPDVWAPTPVKLTTDTGASVILSVVAIPVALFLIFGASNVWSVLLIPLAALVYVAHRRRKAAASAVGAVALEIHPKEIQPGEELHVMLELQPAVDLRIEHIRLTLASREKVLTGSGTDLVVHEEQAFSLEQVFGTNMTISSPKRFTEEVTFELPVTAPCTFDSGDNEVETVLRLEIKPEGKNPLSYVEAVHVGLPPAREARQ